MEETVNKFKEGDQLAFRSIYDSFYRALCSYCYRIVGEVELTNDFVQDCFVALWNKRVEFTTLDSIRFFLYATLRNRCINHLKHRHVEEKHQEVITQLQKKQELSSSFLDLIIEEELHRQLMEAIESLPESYRKVFILSLKDKQNQEIAEILGLSVNTVRNQKQRGYAILRKKLGSSTFQLLFNFF